MRYGAARRRVLALLTMIALAPVSLASASQDKPFDLDAITLPTDLVAAVVSVEDDIVLSHLLDNADPLSSTQKYSSNSGTSSAASQPQTTVTATLASDQPTDQPADQPSDQLTGQQNTEEQITEDSAQSASGSIFDDVIDSTELETVQESESTPKPVPEPIQETDLVLAAADQQPETAAKEPDTKPESEGFRLEIEEEGLTKSATDSRTTAAQDTPSVDPQPQSESEPATELAAAAPVTAVTEQDELAINEDEIILGWATAWSNNDVEGYLDYYADDFTPSAEGVDLETWKEQRRKRLQNQDIRIIVSNAELVEVTGDEAEVRFTQRYTSKSYKDRVIKSIRMKQTPGGWKFLSERTVEELPFK